MISKKKLKFFVYIEKREIVHQGFITKIQKSGGAIVCLYDWILGEESDNCEEVTKDYLENCVFFNSTMAMRAYTRDHKNAFAHPPRAKEPCWAGQLHNPLGRDGTGNDH